MNLEPQPLMHGFFSFDTTHTSPVYVQVLIYCCIIFPPGEDCKALRYAEGRQRFECRNSTVKGVPQPQVLALYAVRAVEIND